MIRAFAETLAYSRGIRETSDLALIGELIPGCVGVEKTGVEEDKAGVDYYAYLRRDTCLKIDAKTRRPGAAQHWKWGEPELALEVWSVVPSFYTDGKPGWTLDESKDVDLILYTFDPTDSDEVFLLSFGMLRIAFVRFFHEWKDVYKIKPQDSGQWKSRAIFVPASVVIDAISQVSRYCMASSESERGAANGRSQAELAGWYENEYGRLVE